MTTCTASCRCAMESRFGGSRLDFAEMSVQTPRRGSGTPGWKAASSPNNSKVRIDPPMPMGRVYQIHIATYVSPCRSVYSRHEARTYERVPRTKHLFLPLQFFGATAEFQ